MSADLSPLFPLHLQAAEKLHSAFQRFPPSRRQQMSSGQADPALEALCSVLRLSPSRGGEKELRCRAAGPQRPRMKGRGTSPLSLFSALTLPERLPSTFGTSCCGFHSGLPSCSYWKDRSAPNTSILLKSRNPTVGFNKHFQESL